MDTSWSDEHPAQPSPSRVPLAALSLLPREQTLVGAWQTGLRADFAALAAKRLCAPLLQPGEARVELKGVQRAHALCVPGEGRTRPTTNFLLLALPPRENDGGGDLRLVIAVTQGHERDEASAVAGLLVLETLAQRFVDRAHWDVRGGGLKRTLQRSLQLAHRRVLEVSASSAQFDPHWNFDRGANESQTFRGITTTVTAAAITGRVATFAHVGVTAAHLARDTAVERATPDHAVSALPGFASLIPADADRERFGDLARRAVGQERELVVDTRTRHLRRGDLIILSTSGLAASFEADEDATAAAASEVDLGLAARRLSFLAEDERRDRAVVVVRVPKDA